MLEVKLKGANTNEWVETSYNLLGQPIQILYPSANATLITYNNNGQMETETDPDGVLTRFEYNGKGEREYTSLEIDGTPGRTEDGLDRITRRVRDVFNRGGVTVFRTRTFVWPTLNNAASICVSTQEVAATGLRSWSSQLNLVSESIWKFSGSGNRYLTNKPADGSYSVQHFQAGQIKFFTRYSPAPAQLTSQTYSYDTHKRNTTAADARTGASNYTFDNLDRIISATTPTPGNGQGAQVTSYFFNNMGWNWKIVFPDQTSVTNIFWETGELKTNYGSRTYPVSYQYDGQGRLTNMTTWRNFASGTGAAITTWGYDDGRGFLTEKKDHNGQGALYEYSGSGRLSKRTWARGNPRISAIYAYQNGDLGSITYNDGATPVVTHSYDRLGRKLTIGITGGLQTSHFYNDQGQLTGETYSGGTWGGLRVTNKFDSLYRRTEAGALLNAGSLGSSSYAYDNASRLSSVSSGNYNATYTYLANSHLISQVLFKETSTTRMTTTKGYDNLNRLTSISSVGSASSASPISFSYLHNEANQRVRTTLVDGSYWRYEYDKLGQVISGKKYWADGTPVAGQQFEYGFDDIGNRSSTKAGGNETGGGFRSASYTVNNLNQYSSRTVPGGFDVIGAAKATATLTINGNAASVRSGEYFWKQESVANSSVAVWQAVNVSASDGGNQNSTTGNVYVAKTPEDYLHDLDGNLTKDGRWDYTWDAENRLIKMESFSDAPAASKRRLTFEYDSRGRRITKKAEDKTSGSYVTVLHLKFLYDDWNLLAALNATNNAVIQSYSWGLDLSGSMRNAGGVGGLLSITDAANGTHFSGYDGNGNVAALVKGTDGTVSANYEYAPFDEHIRQTGPMAKLNPFRFSTKYQDDETDLVYYGYRYYNVSSGRWLNRDPLNDVGFKLLIRRREKFDLIEEKNLFSFIRNSPIDSFDFLGLLMPDRVQEIERMKYQDAINIALSGLIARLEQACALKAGDIKKWEEIQKKLKVVGNLGISKGENSYVDQWENSSDAWALGLYFAPRYFLDAGNKKAFCCTVTASEFLRQAAFLEWLLDNPPYFMKK